MSEAEIMAPELDIGVDEPADEYDSEGEDLSAIEEPSGLRTDLKVNKSLANTLEGVPNIRATKFNSAKQLTFA